MSGCSESDADSFQRASPAAGQICWGFSVGLGLEEKLSEGMAALSPQVSV